MRGLLFVCAGLLAFSACDLRMERPGPVVLDAPADGSVLGATAVEFSWWAGERSEWQFQVGEDGFSDPVRDDTVIVDEDHLVTWSAELPADGEFDWRVRARSSEGVWGDWSETRSFTIERYHIVTTVSTPGYPQDIWVLDNRAYIADGQAGLAVFDVSVPASPVLQGGVMDSLNEAHGVYADDSLAFVAYGYKELLVADVRNPDSMFVAGELEYPQPGFGFDIARRDSFLYIAADAQFIIVKLVEAAYPELVFQYRYPRGLRGVCLQDSLCFLALEQIGVAIWNVGTIPPVAVGSFDTPSNARSVAAVPGHLYVADGRNGVLHANVSDPANPVVDTAALEMPGYATRLTARDSLLVVGCGDGGVAIVDITEPGLPELSAIVPTPNCRNATVSGGRIYACDRDLGLVVIERKEQLP